MIIQHQDRKGKEALAGARRLLLRAHRKAEFLLRIGEPGEVIVKTARLHHCSEIIMGGRGLGSLKGLLLGSVTTKVIHATRVPVTVVP
jgi:nucleotide-binding universal stress UspA family protein